MSGRGSVRRSPRRPGWRAQVRPRVAEISGSTLVWVLLWGTFTPLSIVGGAWSRPW